MTTSPSSIIYQSPGMDRLAIKINSLVNLTRVVKVVHNRIGVDEAFLLFCLSSKEYRYLKKIGISPGDLLNPSSQRLPVIGYNNYGLSNSHDHHFTPYPDLVYDFDWYSFHEVRGSLSVLSDIGREETSVQEVKDRVSNWIVNIVAPLYLESLFTS